MPDVSFTQASLLKLIGTPGKRLTVGDPKTIGLRAELREGGAVSFYLFRRLPSGGPIRVHIGRFPELSVADARNQAAELIARIRKGENPAQVKRLKRSEPTLKELFDHYLEHHAKPHKKTWEGDERQFNVYLVGLHRKKLSAIHKGDVQMLHGRIGVKHGKYQANRVLALLRAMFNKADEIGFVGANPASRIKKFKEESRDRFLQPEELAAFFKSVLAEPNEKLRDFFMLSLFTGQRRSNMLSMSWSDIDLNERVWRLPTTKQGKPHYVKLAAPAVQILARRTNAKAENQQFVFPGHVRGQHLKDPMKAWKSILARAEITGLRIHDLRRTLGSYAAINGSSLAIIGGMLGHSRSETTAVYARLTSTAVGDAIESTVALIESVASPKVEAAQ